MSYCKNCLKIDRNILETKSISLTHIYMTNHKAGRHIFMFVMLCYAFIVTFSIFRIYLKISTLNLGRKPGKLYNELTIEINFREHRRSNQEQKIQRNWQYSGYMTREEDKQNKKHNTDSHNDEQNGPHQKRRDKPTAYEGQAVLSSYKTQ